MENSVKHAMMVWKDDYLVGFKLIDEQHQSLVKMTNELLEACNAGETASNSAFVKTIHGAVEYAQVHFFTEEKYMKLADYPELEEHKKEHKAFVDKVQSAVSTFEDGKVCAEDLILFLKDWLIHHIAGTDKKYAPYLAKLPQ
jgi:hemerythrin-like metal-binding protein